MILVLVEAGRNTNIAVAANSKRRTDSAFYEEST